MKMKFKLERMNKIAMKLIKADDIVEKFRRVKSGKTIAILKVYLKMGTSNKSQYWLVMVYREEMHGDFIHFMQVHLGGHGDSGTPYALSNMQNKPTEYPIDDIELNENEFKEFVEAYVSKRDLLGLIDDKLKTGLTSGLQKWFKTGVVDVVKFEFEIK